jgi:hypothetical protein
MAFPYEVPSFVSHRQLDSHILTAIQVTPVRQQRLMWITSHFPASSILSNQALSSYALCCQPYRLHGNTGSQFLFFCHSSNQFLLEVAFPVLVNVDFRPNGKTIHHNVLGRWKYLSFPLSLFIVQKKFLMKS